MQMFQGILDTMEKIVNTQKHVSLSLNFFVTSVFVSLLFLRTSVIVLKTFHPLKYLHDFN